VQGAALSLVIPAYNEAAGIAGVLAEAKAVLGGLGIEHEIVVVDDRSSDDTADIAERAGVTVLRNVENGGYGYSLMRGIRHARHETVAIIDADGSYPVRELPRLLDEYRRGFAMVVGARQGTYTLGSRRLRVMRGLFRALTQFITGRTVPDVNSGMRVFTRDAVLPLFPHMSYGFSFTTSITLLFMMQALPVGFVEVPYLKRKGSSKVNYLGDSLRALQIVTSITARLNPIKLFLLAAVVNLTLLLPLVAILAMTGDARVPLVLVVETSALLAGLGFVVEALIDKSPFDVPRSRGPSGR
jgi:glycosyltransferase involved in cell wall biosynthesis